MKVATLVQPTTFLEAHLERAELHAFAGGQVAVFSARAPDRGQDPNEDAAALIPYDACSGVLVVADGAGGMPAGEVASRLAIEALVATLEAARAEQVPLRTAILDAIERANQAVVSFPAGCGTTIAVAEISDGVVRPYHVGDSPILVTSQRGRVKLHTVMHSPVGYALEAGMLDEAEAANHADRHVVSNLLGTADMRIEIGPSLDLASRDTVVVASDGLVDNLYVEEITDAVRKGGLAEAAELLAARCRERMQAPDGGPGPSHPDDLTFILFRPTG